MPRQNTAAAIACIHRQLHGSLSTCQWQMLLQPVSRQNKNTIVIVLNKVLGHFSFGQ